MFSASQEIGCGRDTSAPSSYFSFFSAQTFRFIPGLLLGEKGDWSLRYFSAPAVVTLFISIQSCLDWEFSSRGYFCLDCYMRERSRAWLFLAALLFVALIEVKMLIAAQLMCSLALAAVVYLIIFSKADLFKIAGCTAIAAIPVVSLGVAQEQEQRTIVTKFEPWLYVSHAMQMLGLGKWVEWPACFRGCSAANLPCGLPGAPRHWRSCNPHCNIPPKTRGRSPVLLGIFVVIGVVIALTCSFTPAGWTFRYNPISSTFLVQSEYVHGFLQLKFFKRSTNGLPDEGCILHSPQEGIIVTAAGLSLPATVQHFLVWRDPDHFFGAGKPCGRQLLTYDPQTLTAMDFLQTERTRAM